MPLLRIVIIPLSARCGFAGFRPHTLSPSASEPRRPYYMRRDVEPGRATFVDVLDRVLDKGIVIEGWGRVAVAGIDLIGIDGWVVVASIHTYLNYAESLGLSPLVPTSASPGEGLA